MARRLRVEYPGAIYHVMNRGDRREPIFRDEDALEELSRRAEDELKRRRKGDRENVKIAARLRRETTMTLKWIAERLYMGTWTNVANCLAKAKKNVKSRD
jgi:hypothetical protein